MKKITVVIASLILMLIISGCGTSTKVTKEDVISGALNKSMDSFETDMKTELKISSNGQDISSTMDIALVYKKEPFLTHMKMSTIEGEIELYIDRESTYMMMPAEEGWIKAPTGSIPEFEEMANGDSIQKDLDKIKEFSELFSFKQIDDGYVLDVKLDENSSDQEKELVTSVLTEEMKNQSIELLKINSFNYSYKIDKDYNLKNVLTEADLEVNVNGETTLISIKADADYKNINGVKDFSIPAEVKDHVIEMELGN
ncbi:hypothetical protein A8F94_08165 [Bacillus sp. FJAT-27225]|uniref:DUF6612 family protein n=1 Tax=Bacillus sp. FJAT-27225 TaxID=1743144 RepID=UPI00080C30CB|nr:DUF6612 family protein [Bacillus sp. FJAT-27225]OCA87808.1 hypothetical protein A8F94_08165 [Bacillus sp. FJAT-27225]